MAHAEDSYKIRRTLTEGAVEKYSYKNVFDANIDLSSFGAPNMSMTMTQSMIATITYGKADATKKTTPFDIKVTEHKLDMEPAMPGGPEIPTEFSLSGALNELNSVSDMKADGMNETVKMMSAGALDSLSSIFEFPEAEIKVGETWKSVKSKKSLGGDTDEDITHKLVAAEKLDGVDVLKIESKGKVTVRNESAEGMGMGPMKSTTEVTVDSITYLNKATGQIVKTEAKSVPMNILTDMGGMTIPMKGTYTTLMELVKPKS